MPTGGVASSRMSTSGRSGNTGARITRATSTPVTIRRRLFGFTALIYWRLPWLHARPSSTRSPSMTCATSSGPHPRAEGLHTKCGEFAPPRPRRAWFALMRRDPAPVDPMSPLRMSTRCWRSALIPERAAKLADPLRGSRRWLPSTAACRGTPGVRPHRVGLALRPQQRLLVRSLADRQYPSPAHCRAGRGVRQRVHAIEALDEYRRVWPPRVRAGVARWLEPVVGCSGRGGRRLDVAVVGAG